MTSSSELSALFGAEEPQGGGISQRLARRMLERGESLLPSAAPAPAPVPPAAAPASPGVTRGGGLSRASYARFIPGEELGDFSSWQPDQFGTPRRGPPLTAAVDPAQRQRQAELAARQAAARAAEQAAQQEAAKRAAEQAQREQIFQQGFEVGRAEFERFKQSHQRQTGLQVAQLMQSLQDRLDQLEQTLAGRVVDITLALARQVVRSELRSQPEQVLGVTQEALGVLLNSARQIAIHVHPDDHALIAAGAADLIEARGARLVPDAGIEAGGCLIESDIGAVDARVATRWQRASAALGGSLAWQPADDAADAAGEH